MDKKLELQQSMKVLFDLEPLWQSQQSGVFIYAINILKSWYEDGIENVSILTNQFLEEYCKKHFPKYPVIVVEKASSGLTRMALITGWRRKKVIDNSQADVVFNPIPEPFYFWKTTVPEITTIHDLYGEKFATGLYKKALKYLLPLVIKKSKRIIAISKYTKKELTEKYSWLSENKVSVVHNGISNTFGRPNERKDGNYILYVNNLDKYKNPETLIKAFGILKDEISQSLIIVGRNRDNRWEELIALSKELGIQDRVSFLENISQEELITLYQNASVFVSPSSMEGFGQTPVEAAICGCPVVVSSIPTLLESTRGLVNYYSSVFDDVELSQKIKEVISSPYSLNRQTIISDELSSAYSPKNQGLKVYRAITG